MFSVICVYNNEEMLNEILLSSLKNQNFEYELILVDNTKKQFSSAAKALNFGACQGKIRFPSFCSSRCFF